MHSVLALALAVPLCLAGGACSSDDGAPSGPGKELEADGGTGTDGAPGGGDGAAQGDSATGDDGGSGSDGGVRAGPGVRPDATNTGVPPGTPLTTVSGDLVIDQDNAVVEGKDVHGFVIIKASHVVFRKSMVRGRSTGSNGAGIDVQSGNDILIEDVEVGIDQPSVYLDGVWADNTTVRRANIHGSVDGMKVGSHASVEYSYIHDVVSFASDPNQGGGPTHNDAIQILAGTDIHLLGNALIVGKDQNAGLQVTQDFGAVTNLLVEGNFANGGGCTFNLSHKGAASLAVTTHDNRFGRNSFYDCPVLKSTQTTLTSTGDVWDDDGTAVPVQTHD